MASEPWQVNGLMFCDAEGHSDVTAVFLRILIEEIKTSQMLSANQFKLSYVRLLIEFVSETTDNTNKLVNL